MNILEASISSSPGERYGPVQAPPSLQPPSTTSAGAGAGAGTAGPSSASSVWSSGGPPQKKCVVEQPPTSSSSSSGGGYFQQLQSAAAATGATSGAQMFEMQSKALYADLKNAKAQLDLAEAQVSQIMDMVYPGFRFFCRTDRKNLPLPRFTTTFWPP